MATILTVHGTGATGPETGEQWWQKGSEFEGRMRRLVEPEEGDAGELNFQPVIWDGANSETSRRAAGTELCGKMNELEARAEPYSIIGHSHGGSVISAALINHAGKRCTLDHLKNWITVGTPFIQSRKERFLFLRLGAVGKFFYGVLLSLILFVTVPFNLFALYIRLTGQTVYTPFEGAPSTWDIFLAVFSWIFAVPFVIFYYVGRRRERNEMLRYQGAATKLLEQSYSARNVSLWHENDEAIQSLASLKNIRFNIFGKGFARGNVRTFMLFFIPIIVVALSVSNPSLMRVVNDTANSFEFTKPDSRSSASPPGTRITRQLAHDGKSVWSNMKTIVSIMYWTSARFGCGIISKVMTCSGDLLEFIGFPVLGLFVFVLFIPIRYAADLVAGPGSAALARMLNPIARDQIRASAFGADTQVDEAVDARSWPMWMERGQPALPDELASEIQVHADKAAALAIPKFRNAARLFASSRDDANPASTGSKNASSTDMLSDYLTWDELIHTSYFTNQRFCKLVAYALTQNGGLRATAAFKADPDYALVAKWHEGIVGSTLVAA